MVSPYGVQPGAPGYAVRAAPTAIPLRPMPVPLASPGIAQPIAPNVLGLGRPMPTNGLAMPSRAGGLTVQQPSVLVPGAVTRPGATMPVTGLPTVGRPMPSVTMPGATMPGATYPSRVGGYTPQQPSVLVPNGTPGGIPQTFPGGRPTPTMPQPGIGQYPSRTGTPTQPGTCGMFQNYGLIGFFDNTVGAVVKRLLGMRDVCTPGYGTPGAAGTGQMTPRTFR